MSTWVLMVLGTVAFYAWRSVIVRGEERRRREGRCVECGRVLEREVFRFEGNKICGACAEVARQDVTWAAWAGWTLGALGILGSLGVLLYYLVVDRPVEVTWVALPTTFGGMFLWAMRVEALYLRRQNRLGEEIDLLRELAGPDNSATDVERKTST